MNELFKQSLRNNTDVPLLVKALSMEPKVFATLQECIEKIDDWRFVRRIYERDNADEMVDKTQMRQEVRDIYDWLNENFVYPDLLPFKEEVEKFMEKHQIESNPVYIS